MRKLKQFSHVNMNHVSNLLETEIGLVSCFISDLD